jgi:hypothetical protein
MIDNLKGNRMLEHDMHILVLLICSELGSSNVDVFFFFFCIIVVKLLKLLIMIDMSLLNGGLF